MSDPFDAEALAKEWLADRPPYEGELGVIRSCEPDALAALLTRVRREAFEEAAGMCEQVRDLHHGGRDVGQLAPRPYHRGMAAAECARDIRALIPEGGPASAAEGDCGVGPDERLAYIVDRWGPALERLADGEEGSDGR